MLQPVKQLVPHPPVRISVPLDLSRANGIATFRSRVRELMQSEAGRSNRSIVVLAIDGIPARLAFPHWKSADREPLRSVFPTTSSAAWLTCLSGEPVDVHGIPGVVFALDDGRLINLYQHQEPWIGAPTRNVFTDAIDLGYLPIAVSGDLEVADCSWSRLIVKGARTISGHRFFAGRDNCPARTPEEICNQVRMAGEEALARELSDAPRLVWCFVEVDRHIHRHGYDDAVMRFLAAINVLASRWADEGYIVVCHSDHGLVSTAHDSAVASVLEEACERFSCVMGGAGRARWFHGIAPSAEQAAIAWIGDELGEVAAVYASGEFFQPGSLAHRRVGSVVVVARTERFVTFDGHAFDHGSLTPDELETPYACWRP